MKRYSLNKFDSNSFIQNYWQKRPVVLRNVFENFQDPIDEHELAGLAQEEVIDSRIISRQADQWQVFHGPFEDFQQPCQGSWSLLVQGVDNYVELGNELMQSFSFIPTWRMDDLMVSYSVEGAGVGPHLDQYDVFIVQGKGTRRWQVGEKSNYQTRRPHKDLSQIEMFSPMIDEVLNPGDIIYIPPGFPHNGVALEPCMNYSIGFRAETQSEMLSSFSDYVLDSGVFKTRYTDPDLQPRQLKNEIKQLEIGKIRTLVSEMIDSPHFDEWLGYHLSQSSLEDENEDLDSIQYNDGQIIRLLRNGCGFAKQLSVKSVFIEPRDQQQSHVVLFINEQRFEIANEMLELVTKIINSPEWHADKKKNYENNLWFVQFLTKLVNSGLWNPVD